MQPSRRSFLKSSSFAAGSLALGAAAPAILHGQTTKAGTRHTVALIGCGWWGTHILNCALKEGRAKVVGLCDVDPAQLKKCQEIIGKATSDAPKTFVDFREMLDKEKPQLVIVGTPDHWHPLMTIAAVRAGAHVYVEKPIGHTVLEGTAMVKAAREAGRVVQVGTHRRVSAHNTSAREFIRSGKLGTIGAIKCFVNYGGGPEKPQPNAEPPQGMNWDLYCGPAPLRPFNGKIHTRGFRHFLDFANGQLGDWGIHWIDQVLWITERQHPTTVFSTGGRPVRGAAINDGQQQTSDAPDHQTVAYAFDDGLTMTWEHRLFGNDHSIKHQPIGVHFYGTKGVFHLGWQDGWTFYPVDGKQQPTHEDAKLTGEFHDNVAELWKDFVDAIEQGRPPACDIEAGHRATTAALLGMLSLKLGRSVKWHAAKQTIPDDAEAAALLRREYRGPWTYPA